MKTFKFLVLITIVFLIFSCKSGQKSNEKENKESGIKNGSGKITWPDGSLKGTGSFKDNKQVNKWTLFHRETGEKLAQGNYTDGKQDGRWVFFHKNGNKSAEGDFKENKKIGEWTRYYDTAEVSSKQKYIICEVDMAGFKQEIGATDGIKQTFYKSGKLKSEEKYTKGKKNGITREYYEDSKLKAVSEYKNSEYNGKVNKFWPNGKPKEQSFYVNGKRKGRMKVFHDNGAIYIEAQFSNGMKTGLWKFFSRGRKLQKEGHYRIEKFGKGADVKMSSRESGLWAFYAYDKGRKIKAMELTLSGGMIQGKCRLYKKGKLTGEGEMTGIPKGIYDIYKNNKKVSTIQSAEAPPDNPGKNIIHKWSGKWRMPKKNGKWAEFYPGGRANKFEANYLMEKKNGKYTEYYPNGKVKATGEYMINKKNGQWKFYNRDGSLDKAKSGRYMLDKKSKF